MSGKYEKSRFVGVRRTKISFLPRGKIRNQRKTAFPHEGKSKISENRLSSTGENQKSAKIGFPSWGKIRNQQKTAFPREGKSKNAVGSISYSSEKRKTPKV